MEIYGTIWKYMEVIGNICSNDSNWSWLDSKIATWIGPSKLKSKMLRYAKIGLDWISVGYAKLNWYPISINGIFLTPDTDPPTRIDEISPAHNQNVRS